MFWQSVQQGLSVLLHWQTYGAIFEFIAIILLPLILIKLCMERYPATTMGCMVPLLLPFMQTLANIVFVLTMAPLILGRTDGAAWSSPWTFMTTAPWTFLMLTLITSVIGVLIATMHLGLFTNALVGCLVLALVAANQTGADTLSLWPGFWFMVGIVIVSAIVFIVGLLLPAGVTALFGETAEGWGQTVLQILGPVLMFLPMFIYGGWLSHQMRP